MVTTFGQLAIAGVLEYSDGYRTKKDELAEDGFRILRVADVHEGWIGSDGQDFVDVEYESKIGQKFAREGDVLLTTKGTIGRIAVVPDLAGERMVYSPQLCFFRVNDVEVLDAAYLRYWLASPAATRQIGSLSSSTDMAPYLSLRDVRTLALEMPDLPSQRAIGEVLGALDDKIAANRDASNRAEELAVALASNCHQPVRLGEVAQQRRSSVSPMKLGTETVLHFSLPAFDEGKATLESAEEIKSAKSEIENPAVLISKLNPRIPRLWPVDTAASSVRRLASTEFVVLESSELGVGELWAAILHGDVFGQLQSIVGGTSNSHQRVRPQDVLDAVVPDTRVLDQADRKLLVSLCRLRSQLVEANDSLARTRDELLPLLMNGQITAKDAEHAVEGVL